MPVDDPSRASAPPACAAWLMRDVTHVPGVLTVRDDRLRFVSTRRVVFDATPEELELAPSRTRRGRYRVTVDGERLSLAVVRPPGAVAVPADLMRRVGGDDGAREVHGPAEGPSGSSRDGAALRWQRLLAPDAAARAGTASGVRRTRAARVRPRRRALRVLTTLVPRLRDDAGATSPA